MRRGDTDDSSIVARAERRIMAAGDMQGKNDDEEEEEEAEGDDGDDGLDPEGETLEEECDYEDEDEDVIMGGTGIRTNEDSYKEGPKAFL